MNLNVVTYNEAPTRGSRKCLALGSQASSSQQLVSPSDNSPLCFATYVFAESDGIIVTLILEYSFFLHMHHANLMWVFVCTRRISKSILVDIMTC